MRCFICDSVLSKEEVKFNKDHEEWEPCRECLTIISEVFPSSRMNVEEDDDETEDFELDETVEENDILFEIQEKDFEDL